MKLLILIAHYEKNLIQWSELYHRVTGQFPPSGELPPETYEDRIMSPFLPRFAGRLRRFFLSVFIVGLPFLSVPSHAKNAGLTAIEIYPGPSGQNYQQITDFVLGGKNELLLCGGVTTNIDKNVYHRFAKVTLTTGMTLERTADGVLMLTQGPTPDATAPACVVPGNLKFDKDGSFSASNLADKADVAGAVASGSDPSTTQIAPLKPGVLIVFVPAPDKELAEYLRADRAGTISGWQVYFAAYSAGAHLVPASKSMAALYMQAAGASFTAYQSAKAA